MKIYSMAISQSEHDKFAWGRITDGTLWAENESAKRVMKATE